MAQHAGNKGILSTSKNGAKRREGNIGLKVARDAVKKRLANGAKRREKEKRASKDCAMRRKTAH